MPSELLPSEHLIYCPLGIFDIVTVRSHQYTAELPGAGLHFLTSGRVFL